MIFNGVLNRRVRTICWILRGAQDAGTTATLLSCSGGFGKLLVTWEMLCFPELSTRPFLGVFDDDWLPEHCDIASPTIASTDPILKSKLDGSLLELI